MPEKWESCVRQLKHAPGLNPYAVCSARIGRFGGKPTHAVIQTPLGKRSIYLNERNGRHFYRYKSKTIYLN